MKVTMTRLDALCGGPPTQVARCGLCSRTKGPYYDPRQAREALREHVRWRHSMSPVLLPELRTVGAP